MPDIVITTARKANPDIWRRAREWAQTLDAPVVPRLERSLSKLCREENARGVLVVTTEGEVYHEPATGVAYHFHPNLAALRIHNITSGGGDQMIEAMRLGPGDEVLDCTLGLGAEAIVCSHVVGGAGRVVGIEKVPIIAHLTIKGLKVGEFVSERFVRAMRRVQAHCADHREYLPQCEAGSFDVVYFDPIFDEPVPKSQSMEPLRAVADPSPLSKEALEEALRVARRCVVIKQRRGTRLWQELGVCELHSGGKSRVEYGVIDATR